MAREPFEGSEWGERGGEPPAPGAKAPAQEPAPSGRRTLLPRMLVAVGAALVLAAVVTTTGFPPVLSVGELDQPGKAVAAPFEKLHAAQRQKIKEAMSAPFVLGISRKRLDRIAECESHDNPRAIGGGGLYRGKYQFHRGTWASVGGTGDPARASELEQDRRAATLIKQSGSNPWPHCG